MALGGEGVAPAGRGLRLLLAGEAIVALQGCLRVRKVEGDSHSPAVRFCCSTSLGFGVLVCKAQTERPILCLMDRLATGLNGKCL